MRSHRQALQSEIPTRRTFINITPDVARCLAESGPREGLVIVNTKHF